MTETGQRCRYWREFPFLIWLKRSVCSKAAPGDPWKVTDAICDNCRVLSWEKENDCVFFDMEVKKRYVDSPAIAITPYCLRVKDRQEIKDFKQCNEGCDGYRKRKFDPASVALAPQGEGQPSTNKGRRASFFVAMMLLAVAVFAIYVNWDAIKEFLWKKNNVPQVVVVSSYDGANVRSKPVDEGDRNVLVKLRRDFKGELKVLEFQDPYYRVNFFHPDRGNVEGWVHKTVVKEKRSP